MKTMTKQKENEILNCISLLENGDRIECNDNYLFVYNSLGCLINTIFLGV